MILLCEKSQAVAPEKLEAAVLAMKMPPAGPHDRPELTNYDACPSAGVLPSQEEMEAESDPGAG